MLKNVKRILSAVIAGALLCTGSVFSTVSAAEESAVFGDFSNNGEVDATDAVLILRYYNATMLGNEQEYLEYLKGRGVDDILSGDLNEDGNVDTDDAVLILKYYSTSLAYPEMTPDKIWEEVFAGK